MTGWQLARVGGVEIDSGIGLVGPYRQRKTGIESLQTEHLTRSARVMVVVHGVCALLRRRPG
ncbi:hypothetical protein GCM10022294_31790 [Dietzia aurantiaca]